MNWILVAMGGGIGACLRYGAGLWLFKPSMSFPWPTWWINIIGCFAAGIFGLECQQNHESLTRTRHGITQNHLMRAGSRSESSGSLFCFQIYRSAPRNCLDNDQQFY